jgi:hypothetical protein
MVDDNKHLGVKVLIKVCEKAENRFKENTLLNHLESDNRAV